MSYFLWHLFTILGMFWEVFFRGLMALSSGYMVTLLCRHRRRSWHLHITSLSAKASPELRVTWTILLLLGFSVVMYRVDHVVSSSRIMWNNDPIRHCIQMVVAKGYATIHPLLFVSTEKRILNFLRSVWG
jgi:vomeronasal1 receptor